MGDKPGGLWRLAPPEAPGESNISLSRERGVPFQSSPQRRRWGEEVERPGEGHRKMNPQWAQYLLSTEGLSAGLRESSGTSWKWLGRGDDRVPRLDLHPRERAATAAVLCCWRIPL
jgi:hypothetical protein